MNLSSSVLESNCLFDVVFNWNSGLGFFWHSFTTASGCCIILPLVVLGCLDEIKVDSKLELSVHVLESCLVTSVVVLVGSSRQSSFRLVEPDH